MRLSLATSEHWTRAVLSDLDSFLLDHAACERKAAAAAMALVSHYPDRAELVDACVELAREELEHFLRVHRWIVLRGLVLAPDTPSAYMARLSGAFRRGSEEYFLDRLLVAAIAEARGCERFALLAAALEPGSLKDFYRNLALSEVRHQELYVGLAERYFQREDVSRRLSELVRVEAAAVSELPIRAALY